MGASLAGLTVILNTSESDNSVSDTITVIFAVPCQSSSGIAIIEESSALALTDI